MILFIKRFTEWFSLKVGIDIKTHTPPLFSEGEIWWCSVGENVGVEISGKGEYFRRPVIVLKKLDRFSFIGVPLTSQIKVGSWYSNFKIKNKDNTAVLAQIRHIDYRRMDKLLFTLSNYDFIRIKRDLLLLLDNK